MCEKNVSTARVFELREFLVPVKKEPSFSVDGRSARRGKKRELRRGGTEGDNVPKRGDKVVGRKNARKEKSKTYAALRNGK